MAKKGDKKSESKTTENKSKGGSEKTPEKASPKAPAKEAAPVKETAKEPVKETVPAKEAPVATKAPAKEGSVSGSQVKELREKTGAGILECKKALEECGGDLEKSVDWLRKKGLETAKKKSGREASEGIVQSYIHSNNKIGVLLEIRCETDFVAKTTDFQSLAKDICMQIAAANPQAINAEGLSKEMIEREKEIYKAQIQGKPQNMIDQILEGKLQKLYKEKCLLQQAFVKDPKGKQTIEMLIKETIAKLGENIQVKRFARFEVGEQS